MAKEKTKESFVMYDSFIQAAAYLPGEEFKECILKIRDYALYGIDELSNNPAINIVMTVAKPNLDAAEKRRKQAIENGSKGAPFGGMRKGETREEYEARRLATPDNPLTTPNEPLNNPQLTPSEPLNVNVNNNVKKKVNENENENEDGKVNETVDGNDNGKENVVINPETFPSPSPSPSPCPSLNPSSSLQNTFERPQQLDNKDTVIPTCYGPEKLENKTNLSSGGGTADAKGYREQSLSQYLKEMFAENAAVVKKYRFYNMDFDETYKTAFTNAIHYAMQAWGYDYDKAKKILNDAISDWIKEQKEAAARIE